MKLNILKHLSIKWQLIVISTLLIVIPLSVILFYGMQTLENEITIQVEDQLETNSLMIQDNVESIYSMANDKVKADLTVAREIIRNYGAPALYGSSTITYSAMNQISKETSTVAVSELFFGKQRTYQNFDIVDSIQKSIGGTATIFQTIPGGLLRVSTNVLNLEGERAVGTYIPSDSPVYKTIMKGESFFGKAFVVNAWYMTAYEPIVGANGDIIGVLYVGVKESEYQNILLESIESLVVGDTGYVWIIDTKGEYILSKDRARDGENIWEAKDANGTLFIQEIIKKAQAVEQGKAYIHYYPWKNTGEKNARMKIAAATYFPEWDWVIGPSAYHQEFLTGTNKVKSQITITAIIALIAGVFISYIFASYIANPVKGLSMLSGRAAEGDLDITIKEGGAGEIGTLNHSFSVMIQKIKELIGNIKNNVVSTAVSAEQLSTSSEEVNAAMQQISSTVQQIAAGAQNVSNSIVESRKAVVETGKRSKEGGAAAKMVSDKMMIISKTITDGADQIRSLGEKSKEIGKIVDTIDNITRQTNLLALNASIEAARAGDAGRGFAVVADEVRKLAEESGQATEQISALTKNIQAEIQSSVDNMERSTSQVEEGVSSVEQAVKIFEIIPKLVDEINKTLVEVSAVTEQNAAGSGEVSSAVQQVSSSMQQVSSTAQQLSVQAEQLKGMISTFKLSKDDSKNYTSTPAKEIKAPKEKKA